MDWREKFFYVVAAKPLEAQLYQYLVIRFYPMYVLNEFLNWGLVAGALLHRWVVFRVRPRA